MWENIFWGAIQAGMTVSAAGLVLLLVRKGMKKRYPAQAMCLIWALLAVRLLLPISLTLPTAPVQITPHSYYLVEPIQKEQTKFETSLGEQSRWVTAEQAADADIQSPNAYSALPVARIIAKLWLIGAALFLFWQLGCFWRFRKKLHEGAVKSDFAPLQTLLEQEAHAVRLRRNIELRVSRSADCPMLIGLFHLTLWLPDETQTEADAIFVLRHELMHARRQDLWLKLLLLLARSAHWFNPVVHLMARAANEDIELACDRAVVHGLDREACRKYGETILRATEKRKGHELVSCFASSKQVLRRRIQGLFEPPSVRRGIALVLSALISIGLLGCAFSMNGGTQPSEAEILTLVDSWAAQVDCREYTGFMRGGKAYVVYEYQTEDHIIYRTGQRLYFEKRKDGWHISRAEAILKSNAQDTGLTVKPIRTLEQFRLLYENDLGLPDPLEGLGAAWGDLAQAWREPAGAAVNILHLAGGSIEPVARFSAIADEKSDSLADFRYTFADGSAVTVTMVNQFGDAWLPQDWTADGKNERTAADLARQYARAYVHKSGQYLYPILSTQKKQDFIAQQQQLAGTQEWYWKLGGSSPSYKGYALRNTDDADAKIVVFQMYGGGMNDYRSADLVQIGEQSGRRVIAGMTTLNRDYTQSELFKLYYNPDLPMPDVLTHVKEIQSYNGGSLNLLTAPDTALSVATSWGEPYNVFSGTITVLSQTEERAIIRLIFSDHSAPVEVEMQQIENLWEMARIIPQ